MPVLSSSELMDAFKNTYVDVVEVYLDQFESLSSLKELISKYCSKKIIITSRLPKFGSTNFSEDQQLERVTDIYSLINYFDFDIIKERSLLDKFLSKFGASKLIVSYHNYNSCPSSNEVKSVVNQMLEVNADICKIAYLCEEESDLKQMIHLVEDFKQKRVKFILSPMGSLGIMGRMVLSVCGVEWIYCSSGINSTAIGQITINDYRKFISALGLAK